NEKIRDAEKKHRRALSKKERYEYQQYGSEAGVAFKNGVAEGLIDDSDRIPTFAEYLSEVLLEEFEEVKKQANDFIGVFEVCRRYSATSARCETTPTSFDGRSLDCRTPLTRGPS